MAGETLALAAGSQKMADERTSSAGGLHWKSKIRSVHTKMLARGEKSGEKSDFVELWESIASKNVPLWYLQLLGEPEKEGWLVKKGGIGGKLTKRWFVLIGPLLFYFSSEQSDSRAKGVVPLYESEVLTYAVPDKELQKYEKKAQKGGPKIGLCWAIKTRMREFVISCDTSGARDEWIAASVANSELVMEETSDNPKQSIATLRKLLLPPEQMRKELESSLGGGRRDKAPIIPPLSALNNNGPEVASPTTSPLGSPREETVTGALLGGGWRFDAESNVLIAWDLKTDSTWPFEKEEPGLYVTCRYTWSGTKLRALAGSGSRGEWDGRVFRWSCATRLGGFRPVFEYSWNEGSRRFEPLPHGSTALPTWSMLPGALKNSSFTNVREFPDLAIELGSVPPPVALAVAMHKYQWKQEAQGWEA
jgi:hypothetical protein